MTRTTMMTSGISRSDGRLANPYVGPRSIQQGEPLHGRDAEVMDLYDRLRARRIVVLHSPSGAGKSSLVQAGLIPKLREGKFAVWKPIRVNLDPAGIEGVPAGTNRYLLSVMLSLEEEVPEARRRSPGELSTMTLASYLETRPRRKKYRGRPVVLIFDQFEEVLTVNAHAVAAKRAFFDALGEALRDTRYWALFVIREDFLAAFAPYRDQLPTHMVNTFRLDLLGLEGAREAALQPALAGGREFPAVDQLIRDLSTVQSQRDDGSFVAEQGVHVEPVQLQVVCRRLWAAMPADDLSIDPEDIEQYGKVSESLAGYYAQAVAEVADRDLASERAIREWVGEKLIVGGIRSQVRQGAGASGGLDNELIQGLLDSYLVRTEQRAGANWFELSHDRLVEPVLDDNERWAEAHLHPLQVQAKLWVEGRRAQALLLGAEVLGDALSWARDNAALMTEEETEFLRLSRERRVAQRRRRIVSGAVAAVMFTGATAFAVVVARKNRAITAKEAAVEAKNLELEAEKKRVEDEKDRANAELTKQMGLRASMLAKSPGNELAALRLAIEAAGQVNAEGAATWPAPVLTGLVTATVAIDAGLSLVGHEDKVVAVAYAPDGSQIATASFDKTVRLWDANSGAQLQTLVGHEGQVRALVFSGDGSRLATASADKTARIWEAVSGKELAKLEHEGELFGVALSPDGGRVATAGGDGKLRVWDVAKAEELVSFGHDEAAKAVAWSPDGKLLASASLDGTARVWSASDGAAVASFEGHAGKKVHAVAWTPDGARVVLGAEDGFARVWEASSGKEVAVFDHGEAVRALAFSADGKYLASGTFDDDAAHLWEVASTGLIRSFRHAGPVMGVAWSPDGTKLATASWDKTARSWEVRGSEVLRVLEGHRQGVYAVAVSPDGSRMVTGSGDDTARLWDTKTGAAIAELSGHIHDLSAVRFSADGSTLATASWDGTARLWDGRSGVFVRVLKGHEGRVLGVAFSPDGSRVATASADESARVWDAATGEALRTLAHETGLADVMFSPDGAQLLTVSSLNTAQLWASASGEAVELGFEGPVTAAAFSPDGAKLALATKGHEVQLWDRSSRAELRRFAGHSGPVTALAFSTDGQRLATASEDGTARVWDVNSDEDAQRVTLPHEGPVFDVAFTEDGAGLVTASGDAVARVWALAPEPWLAWGCATLDSRDAHDGERTRGPCASLSSKGVKMRDVLANPPLIDGDGPRYEVIVEHGVEYVLIPGGTFMMGSPAGVGDDDEHPQHEVTLDGFYMARTELTNAQYALYVEANPGVGPAPAWGNERYDQPDQPVVGLSWYDAKAYCDWAGCVLPTEAQWEYAARAGTTTAYWYGDPLSELDRFAWYLDNSGDRPHVVATWGANAFGLYDMAGNLWEWTFDAAGDYETSPRGGDGLRYKPVGDAYRVIRGGGWSDDGRGARSGARYDYGPGNRYSVVGFRPLRVIP